MTEVKEYSKAAKAKASDALSAFGKAVADTAPHIDEKIGEQYGDYARRASRNIQEVSAKLETKSLDELTKDARDFVERRPGTALGIAAIFGFLLAKLLGIGRR